ncbi:MAG TPA: PRC-barrel domain-containing protein [Rhodocyclaceae bacterium]|nr:PRC-barrel domain-containing protein [Rhodocyclaceae bacterium]
MKVETKRRLIATLLVPVLSLPVAGLSIAASDKADATRGSMAGTQAGARDVRASKLIGMTVKNPQGETLGKIDDLVVDVNNDRVHYAVLASGGVMGLGGKLFAYPVNLFRPGNDKDELALNVDKDRLKNAPGFERKNWPEWGNSQDKYRADVDKYFGPTVAIKPVPNERLVRASTLIGKDVDDREGKKAGEVKDLVVNMGTGRVHYAVLDFNNSWMKTDNFMPVSLKSFSFPAERDSKKDLVLNVARNQMDASKGGIDKKRWDDMDLNDPNFQRTVDSQIASVSAHGRAAGAAGPTRTDADEMGTSRRSATSNSGRGE